ncbi:MAG: LacI family DNA-binding transcriptional regulator [Oscillospiraceae bacterium]|jgi:DNA-binding LacI/PurR family transcriptional regulator|nr:LacI family DNA-binding transcriptional regulator [Oscillospiraceae bacterium]MDD3261511.1 LacI family DNA-binding transcriptional regulator [Oscillospiraceae bacterium]
MPKAVRMVDIAKRVGVSTVTVSKALADKEGVSDEIRERIKETAQQMGYQMVPASRKSRQSGTGNIGIVVPARFINYSTNSFYWEMYEKAVNRLMTSDYYGILELLAEDSERNLILPRVLQDNKIDGLIVIGQLSRAYRAMLQKKMLVPTVFLDSYDAYGGGYSVISDGYYGMYAVTNYVLSMGHRNIHFLGDINATSSICDRYFGYCRAMMEHNIPVTPDMILSDRDQSGQIGFALPEKLPTAYVCNCDVSAFELINRLEDRGLHVPQDVSVAGFDNYSVPYISMPNITTYAVDMSGMARACVDGLLHQIRHKHFSTGIKIISGRIVVRGSVKKLDSAEPQDPA